MTLTIKLRDAGDEGVAPAQNLGEFSVNNLLKVAPNIEHEFNIPFGNGNNIIFTVELQCPTGTSGVGCRFAL